MTPWITKPVPFNIGQGAAAEAAPVIDYSWVDVQSSYTIDGNKITRSGTGWDAYCLSTNGAPASTGLTITATNVDFSISSYVSYTWLDGSGDPRGRDGGAGEDWGEDVMSYGWYFGSNGGGTSPVAMVRIDGAVIGSAYAYTAASAVFKVVMTSTDVKFYIDGGDPKYTANSGTGEQPDASKTYYMIGSVYTDTQDLSGEMA